MLRVNLDINGRDLGFVIIRLTGRTRQGPCNHGGLPEVCPDEHLENEYELTPYAPIGARLGPKKNRLTCWHIRRLDGAGQVAAQALEIVRPVLERHWERQRQYEEARIRRVIAAGTKVIYARERKSDRRPGA